MIEDEIGVVAQLAEAYLASTEDVAPTMTTFRLAPEHWWTQDQAKRNM